MINVGRNALTRMKVLQDDELSITGAVSYNFYTLVEMYNLYFITSRNL